MKKSERFVLVWMLGAFFLFIAPFVFGVVIKFITWDWNDLGLDNVWLWLRCSLTFSLFVFSVRLSVPMPIFT